MQELNFGIKDPLRRGLYASDRPMRNGSELSVVNFLRPTPEGLKDYWPVVQPSFEDNLGAPIAITVNWPHPQIIRGEAQSFLAEQTTVRYAQEVPGDAWVLTSCASGVDLGGPWHFMDFGTTWMLFNGVAVVYKTPSLNDAVLNEAVTIRTGCAFKRGLAVFGGFDPTDYWAAGWQTYFESFADYAPSALADLFDESVGLGQNWVSWGQIGGGDLLMLFDPDTYTAAPELMNRILQRNEAGALPMPWRGLVQRILPLGEHCIVYGSDGVSGLLRVSQPIPTFGVRKVANLPEKVGVAGRGAAFGNLERHIFVDESGYLWHVNGQLQAEKLGYRDFLAPMLGNEIVISYDEHQDEFWIGDGETAYVLTRSGLGKAPVIPTTVSFYDGGSVGILVDEIDDPLTGSFITVETDLGTRAYKHFSGVMMRCTGIAFARIRVHYRYEKDEAWRQSRWVRFNKNGYAYLTVSAVEFKLEIDGELEAQAAHIEELSVRYQKEDRRYVRGTQGTVETA